MTTKVFVPKWMMVTIARVNWGTKEIAAKVSKLCNFHIFMIFIEHKFRTCDVVKSCVYDRVKQSELEKDSAFQLSHHALLFFSFFMRHFYPHLCQSLI